MRTTLKTITLCASLVAAAIVFLVSAPVQAQTTQFAYFTTAGSTVYSNYVNNGTTAVYSGTAIPVDFQFVSPSGVYSSVIGATLTFTATVANPVVATGSNLSQPITGFTATFTANNPAGGFGSNLLTVTAASGSLAGVNDSTKAIYSATNGGKNGIPFNPSNVTFTSDDMSFAFPYYATASFTNSLISTLLFDTADGDYQSYEAKDSGAFAYGVAVVPEPSSLAGIAIFGSGLAILMLVRKNKKSLQI